jgi:hypothetical protein
MSTVSMGEAGQMRERLAVAAGGALLVAGLLLVAVVMPAEYGVDPLGTGAKLGLVELGATGQQVAALNAAAGTVTGGQPIVVAQERPFQSEKVDFTIAAGQGMEYKYRLEKGESLLFSWTSTAPVNYELHAEPDGAPRGYAQSYEKGENRAQASGTVNAPFSGIHGWFWENTTGADVTVTLTTAGFYNLSHEFRSGAPVKNKSFQ